VLEAHVLEVRVARATPLAWSWVARGLGRLVKSLYFRSGRGCFWMTQSFLGGAALQRCN